MCVILYKPSGVPCPSMTLLDACWESNPHGFGLAIADGKTITIRKGAMHPAEAEVLYSLVQPEHAAIYHWRIATSGLVDAGNCHPFPVSGNDDALRKLFVKGLSYAVAHNGIISNPPKGSKLSDTQLWIKGELAKRVFMGPKALYEWLDQQAVEHNSRFVFLNADKTAWIAGKWYKEGPYFMSNQSHLWSFNMWDHAPCPMCGSPDTQELDGSMHELHECYDCGVVFNSNYIFEPRHHEEAYKEVI